ncbi:MAG: RagB/SusD family nutrient uptake outer membrane protein [Cyclobacteriaceae bacterium]
MKKINKLFFVMTFVLSVSCHDILDVDNQEALGADAVFNEEGLVTAFLHQLYGYTPFEYLRGRPTVLGRDGSGGRGFNTTFMLATITDEARAKSGWVDANDEVVPGNISPTRNLGLDVWSDHYRAIRECNTMIAGLETSELNVDFTTQISAEARWLRSLFYFDLVRRYGDVPLITKPQGLEDDFLVSRTPASEVYQFIFDELEDIASDLPSVMEGAENDRANREAAWALNGRAMLYAERWDDAAEISKRVIDAGMELSSDYGEVFRSHGGDAEVIFEVRTEPGLFGHGVDKWNWPVGYRSEAGGQTNPTQEMVDSYEMINGLPITDPLSGYDPNDPYADRDPRLAATVLYHGNSLGVQPKTGIDRVDTEFEIGRDALRKPNEGNDTQSGYYLKKFMDPSLGINPDRGASGVSFKHLRFGEVLLNYAEAQNEDAGPDQSVYDAVNEVRQRAGIADLPAGLSKDEMRERIRNERKIELAFETHRWFDLIRWRLSESVLNGKQFHGMKVTRTTAVPDPYEAEYDPANLVYDPTFVISTTNPQVFLPHFYLMPIPQEERDRNPNLSQNSGY